MTEEKAPVENVPISSKPSIQQNFDEVNIAGSPVVKRFLDHLIRNEVGQCIKMVNDGKVHITEPSFLEGIQKTMNDYDESIEKYRAIEQDHNAMINALMKTTELAVPIIAFQKVAAENPKALQQSIETMLKQLPGGTGFFVSTAYKTAKAARSISPELDKKIGLMCATYLMTQQKDGELGKMQEEAQAAMSLVVKTIVFKHIPNLTELIEDLASTIGFKTVGEAEKTEGLLPSPNKNSNEQ